jgi:uncharacterized protein with FMN-binding domain
MKRALIVGSGTIVGVAAVLALNPDGAATTAVASSIPASSGTTAGTSGTSGTGSSSASSSSGSSSSGSTSTSGTQTVTGSTVDVGHGYGNIAVQVTITDGRIVDITALEVPQNDQRSAMISSRALPTLVQQAIAAQSSNIAGVSGASYTSYGFAESLKAALTAAGHAA